PAARDARAHTHEAAMMEQRHARAGARPTRRRVDLARTPHERVRRYTAAVRQLVDEDVVHAGLAETGHVHLELSVDGLADRHASLRDAPGEITPHRHTHLVRFADGKHVADAARHTRRSTHPGK